MVSGFVSSIDAGADQDSVLLCGGWLFIGGYVARARALALTPLPRGRALVRDDEDALDRRLS
eukprot:6359845-Lingulodinium_polyedra.AAC.1